MNKISFLLLSLSCLLLACKKEETDNIKALLLGHWNSYETGSEQTGFVLGSTTSLTLLYESGIAFSEDRTFTPDI